jgi:two-component system LytT family response regulator
VAIVDDERLARVTLRRLLERERDVEVVGEAFGDRAVHLLREARPDVVFLDIQMPRMNGFDVLEALEPHELPLVVFVTAYDAYATRAFEVRALDYLVKPFTDERLGEALGRVRDVIAHRELEDARRRLLALLASRPDASARAAPTVTGPAEGNRLAIRDGTRTLFVDLAETRWIEASGSYVRIYSGSGSELVRASLTHVEECLPPSRFFRIHRSAIVNLAYLEQVKPLDHGDYLVVLRDRTELRLSRSRKAEFDARVDAR